jgi:hypothetical protein
MFKNCLIFLFTILSINAVSAQGLTQEQKQHVQSFIAAVKNQDKTWISNHVEYPLNRMYPIPSIKNKKVFLARFNAIFDKTLVKQITTSNIEKDWFVMGWRGIMLLDGVIWLNESGNLIAVNYQSQQEKKYRETLIQNDKQNIHTSIRDYKSPEFIGYTNEYLVRIDQMIDNTFRYSSWKKGEKMLKSPDLLLFKGTLILEGSIGNKVYEFKNDDYEYQIHDTYDSNVSSKVLIIFKKGIVIYKQALKF